MLPYIDLRKYLTYRPKWSGAAAATTYMSLAFEYAASLSGASVDERTGM